MGPQMERMERRGSGDGAADLAEGAEGEWKWDRRWSGGSGRGVEMGPQMERMTGGGNGFGNRVSRR